VSLVEASHENSQGHVTAPPEHGAARNLVLNVHLQTSSAPPPVSQFAVEGGPDNAACARLRESGRCVARPPFVRAHRFSFSSVIDPDRVAGLELKAKVEAVEKEMPSAGKELLAKLKAEKSTRDQPQSARKSEWPLGLAACLLGLFCWWDDTLGRFEMVAVSRILRHRVAPLDESSMYVARPEEEARIAARVVVPSMEYNVVLGPLGCGKSSVIRRVVSQHRGVATFSVASASDNAYARIVEAFGIAPHHRYNLSDQYELAALLRKASQWRAWLAARGVFPDDPADSWVPTVVVEVDHQVGAGTIGAIAKQLKRLGSDEEVVRVILVLGDENAHFALPKDEARQEMIWVNDLSEAEARAVMAKHNFVVTEQEEQLIFRKVGTRVADLVRLIGDVQKKEVPSVEAAVDARIAEARHTIGSLLEVKFRPDDPNKIEFKKIFDALLKSPSGVPVKSFTGAARIARLCGPFFKDDHAFSYYLPERKYVFYSPAFYEAAKELRAEGKY
jgi:hypothetical protein